MGRHYYTPPATVLAVPGLVQKPSPRTHFDVYVGTAEAIAASGLLTLAQLPGQPGLPTTSIAYRPAGSANRDCGWYWAPGFLRVFRKLDGLYRVELNVAPAERARRDAAAKERQRIAREAAERADRWIAELGESGFTQAIKQSGQWAREKLRADLRVPAFLAAMRWDQRMVRSLLKIIDALDEAELERGLDFASLTAAKAAIDRVSRA